LPSAVHARLWRVALDRRRNPAKEVRMSPLQSADLALAALGQSPDVTIGKPFNLRLAPTRCSFRSRRPARTVRARRSRVIGCKAAARAPGDDSDPSPSPEALHSLLSLLGPRDLYAVSAFAERYADDLTGGAR
jgi:hypothetical protein